MDNCKELINDFKLVCHILLKFNKRKEIFLKVRSFEYLVWLSIHNIDKILIKYFKNMHILIILMFGINKKNIQYYIIIWLHFFLFIVELLNLNLYSFSHVLFIFWM